MHEPPERDILTVEFEKERSIRRTVKVLQAKRSRIRDDLIQLVTHLSMLVPLGKISAAKQSDSEILIEALARLDDDVFAQLLTQILQELK